MSKSEQNPSFKERLFDSFSVLGYHTSNFLYNTIGYKSINASIIEEFEKFQKAQALGIKIMQYEFVDLTKKELERRNSSSSCLETEGVVGNCAKEISVKYFDINKPGHVDVANPKLQIDLYKCVQQHFATKTLQLYQK